MDKLRRLSDTLSAFNVLPLSYFSDIDPDEKTVLMLRAHPITQTGWVFNAFAGLVILVLFDLFVAQIFSFAVILKINLIGIILLLAYIWYNFLIWYYTVGFVTTKRIIDVDYHGIVKRVVSQAPIIKLSDVTAKVAGFFGQIFNFGNVHVATEGATQNIEFLGIPHPDKVVAIINDVGTDAAHPD
jgi:membrane protein YdbS with pleckstrin-like domain